jgi:hypothetical protein
MHAHLQTPQHRPQLNLDILPRQQPHAGPENGVDTRNKRAKIYFSYQQFIAATLFVLLFIFLHNIRLNILCVLFVWHCNESLAEVVGDYQFCVACVDVQSARQDVVLREVEDFLDFTSIVQVAVHKYFIRLE